MNILARNWINIDDNTSSNDTISLLTWNTLADKLAEGFTTITDPSILAWENRKELSLNIIKQHNYDIICLQEVDHYDDWFKPNLNNLGYDSIFQPKYNDINDGICIFWKTNKFKLVDDIALRYIKSSQVALFVILSFVSNESQKLCVGTTHLKAKPEFKDTRVEQGKVFMNTLDHITNVHHCPIIFGGDMNDEPDSSVINIFKSKYKSIYNNDNCKWTTWKKRQYVVKRCIDYIFYDEYSIKPVSFLEIPKDEQCPNILPASYHSSDHMSIACRFKILDTKN